MMDFKERTKYEIGMLEFIKENNFKANYFVTLTFRDNNLSAISDARAKSACKRCIIKLNSQLYGRKSKKALKMITFIEGLADHKRVHFHILLEVPETLKSINNLEELKNTVSQVWMNSDRLAGNPAVYDRKDDFWFKEIDVQAGIEKLVEYGLKEQQIGNTPFEPELSNLNGRKIKSR